MSTSIRFLRVFLHTPSGKMPIGYLSAYGDLIRLSFDNAYINDPTRPTLSLQYIGANNEDTKLILSAMRDVRLARNDGKLPVYFQNLLPEGHNRERLAKQRQCDVSDEFELLAAAGRDLMGAIEVEPTSPDAEIPHSVRLWHATLGLDVLEPGFVEFPVENAASLPGVVTKFSVIKEGRRYVIKRKGAAGSYILKLPTSRHPDLVQNEMTCYRLSASVGIDCAEASIISKEDAELPEVVPFDDILAVKRFDRFGKNKRVHMEEFAQVMGYTPNQKYGKDFIRDYAIVLATLEKFSTQPSIDVPEFVRRLVAFILMGNTDAHLKNWALIYPDGIHPQLSPMYDCVCVTAFFKEVPKEDYGLNRTIDEKLKVFTLKDLENLCKEAKVSRIPRLIKIAKLTIENAKAKWPEILDQGPLSVKENILDRLNGGTALTNHLH